MSLTSTSLAGGFFCAVAFAFVQRWLKENRLEPIAVRRCGFCGRHVIVVVGKYDGGLRTTGGKSKTGQNWGCPRSLSFMILTFRPVAERRGSMD